MQVTSIGAALFTKTQQNVLVLLFGNPDKSYYTNEIMRSVGMGRGTVSRELERLVGSGLLSFSLKGNQKYYQANADSPIFGELKSIVRKLFCATGETGETGFSDKDSISIAGKLKVSRAELNKLAARYHIHRLDLFGSAARGELKDDSDIDLLVEFKKGKAPSLGGMAILQEDFSALFGGRKVDVVTPSVLNNPYRRQAIEKDMKELYAA